MASGLRDSHLLEAYCFHMDSDLLALFSVIKVDVLFIASLDQHLDIHCLQFAWIQIVDDDVIRTRDQGCTGRCDHREIGRLVLVLFRPGVGVAVQNMPHLSGQPVRERKPGGAKVSFIACFIEEVMRSSAKGIGIDMGFKPDADNKIAPSGAMPGQYMCERLQMGQAILLPSESDPARKSALQNNNRPQNTTTRPCAYLKAPICAIDKGPAMGGLFAS